MERTQRTVSKILILIHRKTRLQKFQSITILYCLSFRQKVHNILLASQGEMILVSHSNKQQISAIHKNKNRATFDMMMAHGFITTPFSEVLNFYYLLPNQKSIDLTEKLVHRRKRKKING